MLNIILKFFFKLSPRYCFQLDIDDLYTEIGYKMDTVGIFYTV